MNNNVTPERNPIVAVVVPFAWWFLCAGMGLVSHSFIGIVVWSSIYLFVPPAIANLNHATVNKKWLYLGLFGASAWISLIVGILATVIWYSVNPAIGFNRFIEGHGLHLYYLWFILWPGSIFFAVAWFIWKMIQSRNQNKVNEELAKGRV